MMINETNFHIISCEHEILWNSLTSHKRWIVKHTKPKKNRENFVLNERKQFDNCLYL